jgi:hypothetical protein
MLVKVTIDSSDPLEDALRVVGAVYGVELRVATKDVPQPDLSEVPSIAPPPGPATSPRGQGSARRRKKGSGGAKATPQVSNVELRAWARQNGFTVSGRGRLPVTVIAAYRAAHQP